MKSNTIQQYQRYYRCVDVLLLNTHIPMIKNAYFDAIVTMTIVKREHFRTKAMRVKRYKNMKKKIALCFYGSQCG